MRSGLLAGPTRFSIDDGALVEQGPRGAERRYPLAEISVVRIVTARAGPGGRQRSLVIRCGRRRLAIPSHGLRRPFGVEDQTEAFVAFARALCARIAAASPRARFLTDPGPAFGGFDGLTALTGLAALVLLPAALAAEMTALGLDLSARLAFAYCVLLALRPWMRNNRDRGFDPRAIPSEVLPLQGAS